MIPVKDAVRVNFGAGLDTKNDPKQIAADNFLALNNCTFTTGGQLTKRNGFAGGFTKTVNTPNPTLTYSVVPSTLTAARKTFSYNNELCLLDGFNLYSWDSSNAAWNYKGRNTTVGLSTQSIVGGPSTFITCDSSIDAASGIKLFAFADSTNTYYSIQDIVTGQFIVNQALMGAYSRPRCVSISGKSWVLAYNGSGHIYYQAIVGQAVTGSPTSLVSNVNTTEPFFDADVDSFSGNIYLAYYTTSGIQIALLTTSMTVGANIPEIGEVASNGVSFFGDGTNIWVVYNNGSATKAFIVNNAVTATVATPTVIDSAGTAANVNNVTGTWSTAFSKAFIFYDPLVYQTPSTFTEGAAIQYNTATLSGSTITPGSENLLIGSLSINSKAFTVNGIPHIVGLYTYPAYQANPSALETVIQATNFLINIYNVTSTMGKSDHADVTGNIAAKISADEASQIAPLAGFVAGTHFNSSGNWELALLQNSNYAFESETLPLFSPTGVIDCQFNFSLSNPDVQVLGNNAVIAGGAVTMYDGASVVEQNFHIYPNSLTWSSISTSGGGMGLSGANSLYGYIFVYEWIDNQGQVHRSSPSPVVNPLASGQAYTFASGTTTGSVVLNVPFLSATNKGGSSVVVNIYRTVANGSVYFLLPNNTPGNTTQWGTVLNNPEAFSTTYTDTAPDYAIIGNTQLYNTGDLEYYAPPALSALTNFKNRAIGVAAEDPYQIDYSNAVLQNFPVQFVPEFVLNIGTVGGPLVAVAQMDDKMIFFKPGVQSGPAIYYMVGHGPAPSGAGNDFQDPLPVAVDAGLIDRPSVVLTPVGLMFKSSKGIYLLSRSLEAAYIGAPVEAYNQYSVLSAQLIPNTTQVRFIINNTSGGPSMLVYDYFYKKWGTYSPPAGISDCIFQGLHTYVSSAGQVYQETPGLYIDGSSSPVLMNFTTAWIKLAGLVGYQRAFFFYLLGEYYTAHKVQLGLYTDYSTTPDTTPSFVPSTDTLENWRIFFTKQRCQAFQIQFQEVFTGTFGQGLNLSGLNLIVGAKSKFRTISAAQSTS